MAKMVDKKWDDIIIRNNCENKFCDPSSTGSDDTTYGLVESGKKHTDCKKIKSEKIENCVAEAKKAKEAQAKKQYNDDEEFDDDDEFFDAKDRLGGKRSKKHTKSNSKRKTHRRKRSNRKRKTHRRKRSNCRRKH